MYLLKNPDDHNKIDEKKFTDTLLKDIKEYIK